MSSPAPLPQWPAHPRRSRIRGWIWKGLGVIAFALIFLWPVILVAIDPSQSPTLEKGVFELGLFFFGLIGVKCYMRGKRHLAIAATELLAKDPRPPVIYLRSFQHDKKGAGSAAGSRLWGGWAALFDLKTVEERLAEALTPIGPVIAIGKPGEKLPALGAARLYVGDDDWQEAIRTLMARAKLVVLLLGDTPGFWWELERSVKELPPERLVLIGPFRKKRYEAFREQAASHFTHSLPDYNARSGWILPLVFVAIGAAAGAPFGTDQMIGSAILGGLISLGLRPGRGLGKLRGLIYFRRDWTPEWIDLTRIKPAKGVRLNFYGHHRMHKSLNWNMRPVFEQLGIAWAPPKVRRGYLALAGVAAGIIVLSLAGFASVAIPEWRAASARRTASKVFVERFNQIPGQPDLPYDEALLAARQLSRRGASRLDDERMTRYVRMIGERWQHGGCMPYVMNNDDPHPTEAQLGYLPLAEVEQWYRVMYDNAATEIQSGPSREPAPEETRAAYRAFAERQSINQFHEVLWVVRDRTQSAGIQSLLQTMDLIEPFSVTGFIQVSEADICRVFGDLHVQAATLPPPHGAVLVRALAAAAR